MSTIDPAAEALELVVHLEVVEVAVPREDLFEQLPQPGDVPLAVPEVEQEPALGLGRGHPERLGRRTGSRSAPAGPASRTRSGSRTVSTIPSANARASSTARSARRRSVTSRKTSTAPTTAPPASRIGAAPSSMSHSVPSRAIRTMWLARPTAVAGREHLGHGVRDRPAGLLVLDPEDVRDGPAGGLAPAASRSGTRPPGS